MILHYQLTFQQFHSYDTCRFLQDLKALSGDRQLEMRGRAMTTNVFIDYVLSFLPDIEDFEPETDQDRLSRGYIAWYHGVAIRTIYDYGFEPGEIHIGTKDQLVAQLYVDLYADDNNGDEESVPWGLTSRN